MVRCLSVCDLNHDGHLYVTNSYRNPNSLAISGIKSCNLTIISDGELLQLCNERPALNLGDKKFSINQNLTVLCVCSRTERIIMDKNRSYKCPEATEKMLISACTVSLTLALSDDFPLKILYRQLVTKYKVSCNANLCFLLTCA